MLRLQRLWLQYQRIPVGVGEEYRVFARLVLGQVGIRKAGGVHRARYVSIIAERFVGQPGVIVAVHALAQARKAGYGQVAGVAELRPTYFTPFGGNQQYAVGTPDTVNGRSRRIFQDGQVLDLVGVDVVVVADLDAVDQNERIGGPGKRADPPDAQRRRVVAGLTTRLYGKQARHPAQPASY